MNRVTFLFLALLIGSSILTVNSRHEARTLITEKEVLQEKQATLQETIRRLELTNARLAAKELPAEAVACSPAAAAPVAAVPTGTAGKPAPDDMLGDDDGDTAHPKTDAKPTAKTDAPAAKVADPIGAAAKAAEAKVADVKPAVKKVESRAPEHKAEAKPAAKVEPVKNIRKPEPKMDAKPTAVATKPVVRPGKAEHPLAVDPN